MKNTVLKIIVEVYDSQSYPVYHTMGMTVSII